MNPAEPSVREVFVAGGLNEDIKARPLAAFNARTSNPGRIYRAPGGVGRNIAHSLALLGTRSVLCSAAGNDSGGAGVKAATADAGVDISAVFTYPGFPTGAYLAIQDETGDLAAAVSSMEIMDALTPDQLASLEPRISAAAALILDTNLNSASLTYLSRLAARQKVPCIVEPVSVEKIRRLDGILPYCSWISPNLDELRALFAINISLIKNSIRSAAAAPGRAVALNGDVGAALASRLSQGSAPHILVTLGSDGLLLLSRNPYCEQAQDLTAGAAAPAVEAGAAVAPQPSNHSRAAAPQWWAWWYPPFKARVVDANGAGDAFLAGFTAAFTTGTGGPPAGTTVADAIRWGQASAALTLESRHTVNPGLSREAVLQRLAE